LHWAINVNVAANKLIVQCIKHDNQGFVTLTPFMAPVL